MRTVWWTTLLLLAPVPAQEAKEASPAQSEFKKIDDEYKAASKAYQDASAKVRRTDEYKAAAKENDRETLKKLMESVPPVETAKFASRMLELAGKYAGKEDAVPFLTWIVNRAGNDIAAKETVAQAFAALRKDHIGSPQIMDVVKSRSVAAALAGPRGPEERPNLEPARDFFQTVIDKNSNTAVRAQAMFALASTFTGREASDQDKAKAVEHLVKAEKLAKGTPLEATVQAQLFELQRLQLGMESPDIEAEDLDGMKFKLSDYRGKVVVLDFWGDW